MGTSEVYCDPQLPVNQSPERDYDTVTSPAPMVPKEVPAAMLYFPFLCFLVATSVVGRGCSQPAHHMQEIFSEDGLSFTWDSLHKPLQCRAQMPA